MTRTVSPSPELLSELRKLILGRIGEEFDGECHLTDAEAMQAADALESAQSEIARLTTALEFYRDEWKKAEHPFGSAGTW